ncbi:rhodanese-like domain-containing protein [Salidesulfovibrio onnuriiensis]|uniref:rhodanese-like domain-containing protein n=1 Tax=Salidesulfovibrio onnuriiensis TaxID=2583823 RepID=UPI0011CC50CE|nr:rhodanese-like domain-containing protein [Salidesulfovibrio onnuriiensis]
MIRQTFKEIALLLAVSLALAATTYAARTDVRGLMETPATPVLQAPMNMPTAPVPLTAEQAYDLFTRKDVVFVDGRDSFDYDMGHIPGAINIPLHEAQADPSVLEVLPRGKQLVVYCSNELCNTAQKLALMLIDKEFNADIFPEGFQKWAELGRETEGGLQ